jgi:hypothetical protein
MWIHIYYASVAHNKKIIVICDHVFLKNGPLREIEMRK